MFNCMTESSMLVEVGDTSVGERPSAAMATTATRVTAVVALSHRGARGECHVVQPHDPLSNAGCKHKSLSNTARNRRRSTVFESGLGIEVGRCWRLRRAGRPAAYQRRLVRRGDLRSYRWVMVGPAAALIADAMAPYLTWVVAHAGSAVSACETALATMVLPPVIAADRGYLASLVTTNYLGQSTPENAVTEVHYRHMWTHNVEAICCYASSSAATCRLTPFSAPAVEFTSGVTPASGGASARTDTPPRMAADTRLLCAVLAAPNQLESRAVSSFDWGLSTSSSLRNQVVAGSPSACSDGTFAGLAGNIGGGWWCGRRALSGEGLSRASAGMVWQHPCGLDEPTLCSRRRQEGAAKHWRFGHRGKVIGAAVLAEHRHNRARQNPLGRNHFHSPFRHDGRNRLQVSGKRKPLAAIWTTMTGSRHQLVTTAGGINGSSGVRWSQYQRACRRLRWWPGLADAASAGIYPPVLQPDSGRTRIGQLARAHDDRFTPPAITRCVMMRGAPIERAS